MSIYTRIYSNIVSRNVNNKHLWEDKTNSLHRHHIVPKHSGGKDEESNYTYLTVREHQIAHYLLWKIHGKVNDLRSMKMLSARLTTYQRSVIGKWCYDNKISCYDKKYDDVRSEWRKRGNETQRKENIGCYYNEEERLKSCSKGGKKTISDPTTPFGYWASPEGRSKRAALGGKALQGMVCVTNGIHRTRINPTKLNEYLANGYRLGFTLSSCNES